MREKFFLPVTIAVCALITFARYQFLYAPTQREILSVQLETRKLRELERELIELKARHEDLSAFAAAKEHELDATRNFIRASGNSMIGGLTCAKNFFCP